MSRSCRRRSCASLPRRRASAADIASLREEIAALDRGVVKVGQTADLGLARADALGRVMAEHVDPGTGQASAARSGSLRLLPGLPGLPGGAA